MMTETGCDCRIVTHTPDGWAPVFPRIEYCPLHRAAPELLIELKYALRQLEDLLEQFYGNEPAKFAFVRGGLNSLYAVIARAENCIAGPIVPLPAKDSTK